MKKIRNKKPRVTAVNLWRFSTSIGDYFWPMPYDKKGKFIPSSVDCAYNIEYYDAYQVIKITEAL